jgi:lactate dehydrogenase-like 2-hydroxyacid dehydrogenase
MAKPILLVTRKLPEAVEARAARDYDARLNLDDAHGASDGVEIVRRAREVGASGILCAPGDPFDSACINALPPSVKIIATFSVGFDHIDIAAAKARNTTRNPPTITED